jgi:hypothetical protein
LKNILSSSSSCFEAKLHQFITKTIPDIYKLLRDNKVKNSEDMIIDELNLCLGGPFTAGGPKKKIIGGEKAPNF